MQQPIKQRCGDNRATEDFAPLCKAAIRGEDHRGLFVTCVDELEEQIAAAGNDREVTDFVDYEQRRPAVEPDLFTKRSFTLCLGQGSQQVRRKALS